MFARFTLWMQRYYPWIVGMLALICVLTYSMQPNDMQASNALTAKPRCDHFFAGALYKEGLRFLSKLTGLLAAATGLAWFSFAFAGDPAGRRADQVRFAYFFVVSSFAILMLPPFLKSQAIGSEPLGIVSGCVAETEVQQITCFPEKAAAQPVEESNAPPGIVEPAKPPVARNQWLVNIGGALTPQNPACPSDRDECKTGSTNNRATITGGMVVPLPFLIIALFGGAISLSRRVPEIQKRSEEGFVGKPDELPLNAGEAREQLAFQILQFISAPLIAIVAHHVIEPTGHASGIALAFMAGFGSETILLIIRGMASGIAPRSVTVHADTGAIYGAVVDGARTLAGARVEIVAGSLQTTTDVDGHFQLHAVPAGPIKVSARLDTLGGSVDVQVIAGQTVTCIVSLREPVVLPPPAPAVPPPLAAPLPL